MSESDQESDGGRHKADTARQGISGDSGCREWIAIGDDQSIGGGGRWATYRPLLVFIIVCGHD